MNRQKAGATRGGTFIEVMVGCVVLALLAIAGAGFVAQSQQTLAVHRHQGVALGMANSRMEELRNTGFGSLTSNISGSGQVWIKRNGSGWVVTTAADHDDFVLDGATEEIRTGLVLTNWPALGSSRVLRMTVQATYRKPEAVSLTTFYAR